MAAIIKNFRVIDDKETRRARISFLLHSLGYSAEIYDSELFFEEDININDIILLYSSGNIETLGRLAARNELAGAWCPIVIYGENPHPEMITSAIFGGALDFLRYPFTADDVSRCIGRVVRRAAQIQEARRLRADARRWVAKLSPRERDVLSGLVGGMTNKEIGTGLGISARTVEIHRSNLMRKLGARTVVGAVILALESGEFQATKVHAGEAV